MECLMEVGRTRQTFIGNIVGGPAALGTCRSLMRSRDSSPLVSNLADGIHSLKPGQYLWAPDDCTIWPDTCRDQPSNAACLRVSQWCSNLRG